MIERTQKQQDYLMNSDSLSLSLSLSLSHIIEETLQFSNIIFFQGIDLPTGQRYTTNFLEKCRS
jgi:hypothetical protein